MILVFGGNHLVFMAVIFDWDGTLADTESVIVESFQKILATVGCFVEDEFIEKLIGIGDRNVLREALRHGKAYLNDAMLDELARKKNAIQLGMVSRVSLLVGAVELLSSMHGRVKIALASMSQREIIDKLLREKRLRKYFEIVITADEVYEPKPNPEIFLKAAAGLKVRPESCVVMEDSIFGVKAAKDAGMKCVAVATGAYSKEELKKEGADLIVASLNDRERILAFLIN